MNIVLIALGAAVLMLAMALLGVIWAYRRRTDGLSEGIERFLRTGEPVGFSVKDDRTARLQNNINELEDLLALERRRTAEDRQKNADFVADVSHQLKTPLAGVRLYCELLDQDDGTGSAAKALLLLERTERLIAELLKYQKLRADGFPFRFEERSLAQLVRERIDELAPLFPQKRMTVTGDAVTRCDRQWLGEAVGNVLKNACEHTAADGTVNVTVSRAEDFITLAVEDDGGGVPEEQLPRLFERFFRAENASTTGTGLGLAIARAVTEKHHGIITAENGEKGLRVTMTLPVLDGNRKIEEERYLTES